MISKRSHIPTAYVDPWYIPPNARNAAVMKDGDDERLAGIRMQYESLNGRLPLSYMTELQVSLAQLESAQRENDDDDGAQYFSCEISIIDKQSGSVLSKAYQRDGLGRNMQFNPVWRNRLASL